MARLAATASGDAKARVEDDLARVLDALAAAKEDGCKLEAEIACLVVSERRFYYSSRHPKIRCPPFIPRQARTRKPLRKTTRNPYS